MNVLQCICRVHCSVVTALKQYNIQYNTKFVKRHVAVASEALYITDRNSHEDNYPLK